MQQNYTAVGTIEEILPREKRGEYEIQKVVLKVEGYKDRDEFPCFEFFGKKADAVDQFRRGDECEITFNLAGRENKGRWFTTLSAWKIVRPEQPHQRQSSSRDDRPARQPERQQTRQAERPAREYQLRGSGREPMSDKERRYREGSDEDEIPF